VLRLLPLLLLAACKATPVPEPAGPDAAVVVADVRVTGPQSGTRYPRKILFARVTPEWTIEELAWSNYHRGTRVYLFNATPGRWTMACAVPFVNGKEHYVFLPENVVESAAEDVAAGSVVSLGTAVVHQSHAWSREDDLQRRFHALVVAARPKPSVWREIFPSVVDYRGEHGRHTPDDGRIAQKARKQVARWWD